MGQSLEQILATVRDGDSVGVAIVTNQDNGVASFATGSLVYHPSSLVGPLFRPARLSTTDGVALTYYFSDRMLDIDPPSSPGGFGHSPRQPFSANATDKLGASISLGVGPHVLKLTLLSWGNVALNVAMEPRGNLLIGVGAPIGNQTDSAVYVVAFTGVFRQPH